MSLQLLLEVTLDITRVKQPQGKKMAASFPNWPQNQSTTIIDVSSSYREY
jgi:hypothetical protein